jgi:hypothetical protein
MIRHGIWVVVVAALAAGCDFHNGHGPAGPGPEGGGPSDQAAVEAGKAFLLGSEPAGPKGVRDVRKDAKNGEEVVLVGRVGGLDKPFTEGRAAFLVVDPSLKPSNCECPWDYCDCGEDELTAARLNVKFVGPDGKTLKADAREMFQIKELTTVVVKGKLSRDDKDNVSVTATGIFVRPEKP